MRTPEAPVSPPPAPRPRRLVLRVPSDVREPRQREISLEAFQELLLELTGRRVSSLAEMTPQADPTPRGR
jgi:hypothetical protein